VSLETLAKKEEEKTYNTEDEEKSVPLARAYEWGEGRGGVTTISPKGTQGKGVTSPVPKGYGIQFPNQQPAQKGERKGRGHLANQKKTEGTPVFEEARKKPHI